LLDYGARWYDPALGRFVSADTIVPDPANSQSLNRYSYVLGNPLKYTDPSGHLYVDDPIADSHRSDNWRYDYGKVTPQEARKVEKDRSIAHTQRCVYEAFAARRASITKVDTASFDPYPFWDRENGAVRHLVEPCGTGLCTDEEWSRVVENPSQELVFHAYTANKWNFAIADKVSADTADVYDSGPVSWEDARAAAIAGLPNPLSGDQLHDALQDVTTTPQLMAYSRYAQYSFLFVDQLKWSDDEVSDWTNYEPRYLDLLLRSHGVEVKEAYKQYNNYIYTMQAQYEKEFDWTELFPYDVE
jgi:hypothetical protein